MVEVGYRKDDMDMLERVVNDFIGTRGMRFSCGMTCSERDSSARRLTWE